MPPPPPHRRLPTTYEERECRSALHHVVGMGFDWSLNPYTGCIHRCTFCYVRAFERRADRPSGAAYGRTVRVKINIVEVLRGELARRSWRREPVSLGTATDPYQPVEGRVRLTRGCLEALRDFRTPVTVITRGPMVVRDIDVLSRFPPRAPACVVVSVPSLDPDVVRTTEPGTAPPRQRLRALRRLVDAGIRAGVSMAPILPGLSDRVPALEAVIRAARDAGASFATVGTLRLQSGTREHFLEALASDWPEMLPLYEELYRDRVGAPATVAQRIAADVARLRRRWQLGDQRILAPPAGPAPPQQLALGLGG